jgi:hypothetical protein
VESAEGLITIGQPLIFAMKKLLPAKERIRHQFLLVKAKKLASGGNTNVASS